MAAGSIVKNVVEYIVTQIVELLQMIWEELLVKEEELLERFVQ